MLVHLLTNGSLSGLCALMHGSQPVALHAICGELVRNPHSPHVTITQHLAWHILLGPAQAVFELAPHALLGHGQVGLGLGPHVLLGLGQAILRLVPHVLPGLVQAALPHVLLGLG